MKSGRYLPSQSVAATNTTRHHQDAKMYLGISSKHFRSQRRDTCIAVKDLMNITTQTAEEEYLASQSSVIILLSTSKCY